MSKTKRNYHPIRRVLLAMTFLAIAFPVGSFVLLGLSYSDRPVVADDSRPVVAERQQAKADGNQGTRPSRRNRELGGLRARGSQLRTESKVESTVREIQASADDDESKTKATEKLREMLNEEFAKMHDKQADEITKTQERLDKLKKTHQSRGDNQDKIVQRRIDQLLGEPDEFAWIEDDSPTTSGFGIGTPRRSTRSSNPRPSLSSSSLAGGWIRSGSRGNSPAGVGSTGLSPTGSSSVETSSLGEIFQLAREAGNAINSLKIAEDEFRQILKMKSRIPKSNPMFLSEARQAKANFEKMRLVEQFYRQQIEATNRRLEQTVKHAKESLAIAKDVTKMIDARYRDEKTTVDKALKAKQEVTRLKHEYEDAMLELKQFRDATAAFEKPAEKANEKTSKAMQDPFDGDSSNKKDPFGGSSSDDDPFGDRDPFGE